MINHPSNNVPSDFSIRFSMENHHENHLGISLLELFPTKRGVQILRVSTGVSSFSVKSYIPLKVDRDAQRRHM